MPIISFFGSGSGGGSGGLVLAAVTDIQTVTASGKVYMKWTDPDDLVVAGSTLAAWAGTLLVRKAGSAPVSRRDGTVVLDSKTRNAYQSAYFCDSGLTDGVTYYYKFFPYTTSNAYTDSAADEFNATPNPVALGNVTGISVENAGNGKLNLRWTDPAATVVEDGVTVASWANTTVVVKAGSYATDPDDAAAVFRQVVTTRNAYASTPLTATGLTNGTTYYVSFFPISTDGAVNSAAANRGSGTPNRFEITSAPAQSGSLTYNGSSQTPSWDANYDANKMTMSVTGQINAGDYTAYATPKDDYCWAAALVEPGMADNMSPKPIPWSIGKKALTVTATMADKVYSGSNITAPDSAVAKDGATTIGDVSFVYTWYAGASATPMAGTPKTVGTYRLVVSIADSDLRYSGASSEVSFQITAKPVTITGLSAADKVYDGDTAATINGTATISGLVSGDTVSVVTGTAAFANKNVGTGKTITFSGFSLSGADAGNYSLSSQPASVTASITQKEVTVSGITASNKTYDGTTSAALVTSSAVFTGLVSGDSLTVSGTGTFNDANVGTGKNVTISGLTLGGTSVANYKLASSGNQSSTTANITKATGTLTRMPSSVTLNSSTLTSDFTIGGNFDGGYTVASSDTNIATVALVSGKTYRISSVNSATGTATITVTPTGGSNYSAPAAQSIAVTAQFLPPIGTALNDCSWDDIKQISDSGKGANYWAVGDTKTITINGTVGSYTFSNLSVNAYILGFDHNSAKEGTNRIHFQLGKIGSVAVAFCDGSYGSYKTDGTKIFNFNHWGNYNYGGWAASDLRYDILGSTNTAPSGYGSAKTTSSSGTNAPANSATSPKASSLMAALPSDLRAVMKSVTKYTDNTAGGSDTASYVTATADFLFLLAEFEVFGTRSYANSAEQNYQLQYDFYKNGNAKIAYNHSATSTAVWWWLRSPYYSGNDRFCTVGTGGGIGGSNARYSGGLRPGFAV